MPSMYCSIKTYVQNIWFLMSKKIVQIIISYLAGNLISREVGFTELWQVSISIVEGKTYGRKINTTTKIVIVLKWVISKSRVSTSLKSTALQFSTARRRITECQFNFRLESVKWLTLQPSVTPNWWPSGGINLITTLLPRDSYGTLFFFFRCFCRYISEACQGEHEKYKNCY